MSLEFEEPGDGYNLDELGLVTLMDIFIEIAIYTYDSEYSVVMKDGVVKAWLGKRMLCDIKEMVSFDHVEDALIQAIKEHVRRSQSLN